MRGRANVQGQETCLVTVGVTTDDDGLGPARKCSRDLLEQDGLTEDGSAEDVSDGAVCDVSVSSEFPPKGKGEYQNALGDFHIFLRLNSVSQFV
jgi:hypothetical protein